jgi:hypothetical protein
MQNYLKYALRILDSFIAYYFLNVLKSFALSQLPCLFHYRLLSSPRDGVKNNSPKINSKYYF